MLRLPLVVGNWKMHKTIHQTEEFCSLLRQEFPELKGVEVAVAPPFTSLIAAARVLKDSPIWLAAQNLFWAESGPFTGEISPIMLIDVGCRLVIIGHSERRQHFGETDESVNKKLQAAIKAGLIPILCVGETLPEREGGTAFSVVERQTKRALQEIRINHSHQLVVAYEPVWAIGTGQTATPQQAQEMQAFLRDLLRNFFNPQLAEGIRILYGGSVKPENIFDLISQKDVDGTLVGGASLEIKAFSQIIRACRQKKIQ